MRARGSAGKGARDERREESDERGKKKKKKKKEQRGKVESAETRNPEPRTTPRLKRETGGKETESRREKERDKGKESASCGEGARTLLRKGGTAGRDCARRNAR